MNPIASGFLAVIGVIVFLNILKMVGSRSEAEEEMVDHHHHHDHHDDHHVHDHDGHDDQH